MRRSFRALAGCLLLVLLAASAALAQDWKGSGRVDGFINDQDGKPIEGATVTLTLTRLNAGPPPTKTNKSGYWGFLGLAGGEWAIDVSASGYESLKASFGVSEAKPVHWGYKRLQKAVPVAQAEPQVDPAAKAGAEAVAAVTEGNRLMGDKKYADARAQYEKAIALLPPNAALLKGVAQTYHLEGNDAKAVETLRKVVELDPADTDTKLLLASMLVQQGQADEGKALLEALPPGSVKDSAVYFNLAITFMNKKRPEDAAAYFSKAIELDPTSADAYFYRGMAEFQTRKNAEAKADFKKYLELDPNGAEAKDAKEMLQALK